MRRVFEFWLLLLAMVCLSYPARAAFGRAGSTAERATIVVRPDGTCLVTNDATVPRASIEQMARFWQQFRNAGESDDDESPANPKPAETKPLTDQELADAIRTMTKERGDQSGAEPKFEALEVTSNSVHMVMTQSFPTLREMLQSFSQLSSQSGPSVQSVRFETTN